MTQKNPFFWDCKCDMEYIHRKATSKHCDDCGADAENQPDSIHGEVLEHYQHAHIRQRWVNKPRSWEV